MLDGDAGSFRILFAFRVLRMWNCERHLLEMHRVKSWRKRAVVDGLAGANLAASVTDVIQPSNGQTRINRLRVHDGCITVSTSRDVIRQWCSQSHRLNIKTAGMVSRVRLQTFFLENPWYFVVTSQKLLLARVGEQ
jgi:hypothetical protein